ncbi:CU044_2847 family protein [Kitasatospora phosalacinea]|uniref:CU044_2847 family protein n=1 Tax=Kitasatospora phosalacinea TaxID=2065 RepID=UPI0007C696A0|nr:CU044_2847 family protein [Kitasatospora phosalacinea]
MAYAGELRLTDGSGVWVEVDDAEGGGIGRVGRAGDLARATAATLQEAVGQLRPALDVIAEGLRGMANTPETIRVDFGIKLSAEAGVVVTKAASEANFTVSVEWKPGERTRQPQQPQQPGQPQQPEQPERPEAPGPRA